MPKHSFQGGRAFDAGLAALASLSAGFLVFAMPEPVFSGLVETSRLPALVPAAQPPLGGTARFAVLAAVAIFTFSAVWALMAALGRAPAARTPVEPEVEAPRLRRADAHPDAPARRPLLARDLGEPLELDEVAPAPPEAAEPEEVDHRPLPGFLVPQAVEPEEAHAEAGAEAEAAFQPGPDLEVETESAADPEAGVEAPPEFEAPADPLPLGELADQLPEAGEETDQPLAQLVNRIEFGLARKRQALPAEAPPAEEAPVEQEKVGHRLRSAINDLQKIASSGA